MKKQIKKATAKRRTNRIARVALQPFRDLMNIALEEVKLSKTETRKMKRLDIQKKFLKSEAQSKKEVLQYREMLLPEERTRLEAELESLVIQIRANIEKHNQIMGRRATRRKKQFTKCAILLVLCGITGSASYLLATGAMTVLGF